MSSVAKPRFSALPLIAVMTRFDRYNEGMVPAFVKSALARPSTRWGIALFLTTAVIVGGVWALSDARLRAQKDHCGNRLKSIWLGLTQYHNRHGVLPPAKLKDVRGNAILSWRTYAGDYMLWEEDSGARMDFDVAWDSPPNSLFLDGYADSLQCPVRIESNSETDYVAVLGENTMWPADQQVSLDDVNQKAILVVEWPRSGIHWAEPRDITVAEFLEWFDSDNEGFHGDCLLYVNVAGEIHELPKHTDQTELIRMLSR